MKSIFNKIYFLNLDQTPKYSNDQKRVQRLLTINYFLVFSVPIIIINDLILAISGEQAYTFEKYPVLIFWFFCLLALFLAKRKKYFPAKLIVIFSPLLFITSYSLTGYIIGEHFLWQPIMMLGISVIPFLVLDFKSEKTWLLIAFFTFLAYVIFHDYIMLYGAIDKFGEVYTKLNTTPFIYNTVRILIFLFLTLIIYYSIRLNEHQQMLNEQTNDSLLETSQYLETVNAELQAHRNAINNSASMLIADENQHVLAVNDNFLSVSGYSSEDLHGRSLLELIMVQYDASFLDSIRSVLDSGGVWRGELKLQHKKEGFIWMQTAISSINNPNKKQKEILIVMFNITKLKNHDERLEKLNHEKDRILYAVAHDLKNPLLNFKSLLNLIKEGLVSKEEEQEIFRLMTKDCDHSTNLIAELLEIGKLEDDHFVLTKTAIDLNAFLEKSFDGLEQKAEKKGIKFSTSFGQNLGEVEINEKEFVRVAYNLIGNAIKFTPSGGEIKISTQLMENGQISIEISDTGVGISPDLLPIIFDKFSKASRMGIEGEKSTGLGMWIVKHIVELHGGEISVQSKVKEGTTFTILL